MAERPELRALALALGIEDGYRSALDSAWIATRDDTREALAAAMGFDASSESEAERARARLADEQRGADAAPPPTRAFDADEKLGAKQVFGLWTNLYSLRSAHNLGFGQLGDLSRLLRGAAAQGAAFVGLSPLHATTHRPGRFCPYDPVSRLFRDPLYLDPERIPELAECREARDRLASAVFGERLDALRGAARLDTQASERALFELLRPLHATFRARRGDAADERRGAFRDYRAAQGDALTGFASFLALADHHEAETGDRDWQRWPARYRDSRTDAVGDFAAQHAEAVELHTWIQFELDRQLGALAGEARGSGLAIGLYLDLALGSAGGGSDTWSRPGLFARGATVGAPPDAFSREGQDWQFPPLDPHALRRDGFAFWRGLIEANMRHAGALRIDHALGLRRLFWIPEGASPRDGAYVRQPEAELLACIARVSRQQQCLVVAEDLGTVPPGFSEELQARGLLSSRVLLFECDAGGFHPAADYPAACLASANTHDLPPLAALLGDEDLALRRRAGQIPDDAALELLCAERRRDRRALRERLVQDGLLDGDDGSPDALAAAVTEFLCRTPARLTGIALDDLAGESEPINLPGVSAARHPSWTRRMQVGVEDLFGTSLARRVLAAVPTSRRATMPS